MTIGGPFAFVRVWRWVVQVRLGWLSVDAGWHREVVSDWRGVRGGG